ncbi:winged helix-turn-helix transcriptional regulator [Cryptosporangium phraense]|uniref:Helix-turn-helix transcriptional regulator n=1 Tax=Cryptosporangium phraense TaxID=2593070 RepID=A0A545AN34_9ACTN|nr:helix-turn-helix domain-containing protein [Cryptosporangium phraense]TQS42671.1 helix-turn-helix transcriptional regulator [Cryptosporangium phraense]
MPMTLEGPLADRARWQADACSVGKAMDVVGTRSAMLLIREAFYGTTRFDDFASRVGITDAIAAARLKELVAAGIFAKRPYREPGQRTRYEYVLTEMGQDLLPALLALMRWGDRYLQEGGEGPVDVVAAETGEPVEVSPRTSEGVAVDADALKVRLNRRRAPR